jgi:hypothetical protein
MSSNCVNAARHVFAADSPVQSDSTNTGFGKTARVDGAFDAADPSEENFARDGSFTGSWYSDVTHPSEPSSRQSSSSSAAAVAAVVVVVVAGAAAGRELSTFLCPRFNVRRLRRRLRLEDARARIAADARDSASSSRDLNLDDADPSDSDDPATSPSPSPASS